MNEVKKTILNGNCNGCSKKQLLFEFSFPLEIKHINIFEKNGFSHNKAYIKTGIVYLENMDLIAIGPLGASRLQLKLKNANTKSVDDLENILKNME